MRKKHTLSYGRLFLVILIIGLILTVSIMVGVNLKEKLFDNQPKDNANNEQNTDINVVGDNDKDSNKDNDSNVDEPNNVEDINITMTAVGDIMFHPKEIWGGYDEETDTFDYKPYFQYVKPILEKADIAVGNFEGTTCGNDLYKYQGYPLFNAPNEALDALKDAGFDVLSTINNHSLDTRKTGVIRTIERMDERGIVHVGTYKEKPESRILMQNVKGIKIAFLAYTELLNGLEVVMTDEDLDTMINKIDKEKIKQDIADAKKNEADLIVMIIHWGNEYNRKPNQMQQELAKFLLDEGVNIILGSHPHVIQDCSGVMHEGKKAFIAYSTGNFISNQRIEEELVSQTEDGIIINFNIKKDGKTGETTLETVEYTPTWVYREKLAGNKYTYRILPVMDFIESDEFSENSIKRMKRSLEDTMSKLDTNFN
ncbi:CapA family protein [Sedimentibacter sp. zth1]|uniref:CapA family protein n=1 Tax=Sedimentibacter sp. zth1 TaxID=2816908 RepID=UPI001A928B86|nr:CapA family protein [Sedimentibacter sp. zth1]QSX06181.1 CapA family protein [Sedimentibacter sp. zth1]